jgi:hypothetical protein
MTYRMIQWADEQGPPWWPRPILQQLAERADVHGDGVVTIGELGPRQHAENCLANLKKRGLIVFTRKGDKVMYGLCLDMVEVY